MRNTRVCGSEGCNITNATSVLFSFPKDRERRRKWMANVCLKTSNRKEKFLCPAHFDDASFTDTFRRRLIRFAIPKSEESSSVQSVDREQQKNDHIQLSDRQEKFAQPEHSEETSLADSFRTQLHGTTVPKKWDPTTIDSTNGKVIAELYVSSSLVSNQEQAVSSRECSSDQNKSKQHQDNNSQASLHIPKENNLFEAKKIKKFPFSACRIKNIFRSTTMMKKVNLKDKNSQMIHVKERNRIGKSKSVRRKKRKLISRECKTFSDSSGREKSVSFANSGNANQMESVASLPDESHQLFITTGEQENVDGTKENMEPTSGVTINSSSETPLSLRKNRKKKCFYNFNQTILASLKETDEALRECISKRNNSDSLFCWNLKGIFVRIPEDKRAELKVKILQLCSEYEKYSKLKKE